MVKDRVVTVAVLFCICLAGCSANGKRPEAVSSTPPALGEGGPPQIVLPAFRANSKDVGDPPVSTGAIPVTLDVSIDSASGEAKVRDLGFPKAQPALPAFVIVPGPQEQFGVSTWQTFDVYANFRITAQICVYAAYSIDNCPDGFGVPSFRAEGRLVLSADNSPFTLYFKTEANPDANGAPITVFDQRTEQPSFTANWFAPLSRKLLLPSHCQCVRLPAGLQAGEDFPVDNFMKQIPVRLMPATDPTTHTIRN